MFTKPILFDDTDGDNDDELKFRGDGDCDDVGDPLTNDVRIDVGDGYDSSWLDVANDDEWSPDAFLSVRFISLTGLDDHAGSLHAF